jgi:hypothetical protein
VWDGIVESVVVVRRGEVVSVNRNGEVDLKKSACLMPACCDALPSLARAAAPDPAIAPLNSNLTRDKYVIHHDKQVIGQIRTTIPVVLYHASVFNHPTIQCKNIW